MSFSAQWFSKLDSKDNKDKRDITKEREAFVPSVPFVGKSGNLKIDQWGNHAHLVEWFLQVKDSLPRERFIYDQGDGWQVIWATPAASYENLAAEIEKGPGNQWDAEVRSILEQLYNRFANAGSRENGIRKTEKAGTV
ncbi:MAG: hypothetical protein M0R18_02395 [Deltaproteobacteria bacterium]|jgi:hypothetical protein|nr:hypothetical protein [Deltaproteobacteria bacterium]MDX9763080.1 hypothetical protein [Desulfomonilia bacterium]